jgi:hypothetical protein
MNKIQNLKGRFFLLKNRNLDLLLKHLPLQFIFIDKKRSLTLEKIFADFILIKSIKYLTENLPPLTNIRLAINEMKMRPLKVVRVIIITIQDKKNMNRRQQINNDRMSFYISPFIIQKEEKIYRKKKGQHFSFLNS